MSLRSMTGFGRGNASGGGHSLDVEVRTVNHRYLDVRVHLARELTALEHALVAQVRRKLRRGRVDVQVRLEAAPDGSAGWRADLGAARALKRALVEVQDELGLPGEVDATAFAGLAERFLVPGRRLEAETLEPLAREALSEALRGALSARAAEGEAIEADLRERVGAMRAHVESLAARAPEVVAAARERLDGRVTALLASRDTSLDPGRLEQEMAILADRSDVAEELQRLGHHLDTLDGWLDGSRDAPVGRRLDFLAQELGREANTVASKVSDAEVAALVVELKAEIERLREQAANVE